MSMKKVFKAMLDNSVIKSSQEMVDAIEIIGEVLQAEETELSRIGNFYTPDFRKTKEFYTDISTRYDSENFINILRDYNNMPKTVNKLIPIHRRRASNNIMKLLTKEYFKGYVIELSYNEESQEMILEIFVDADTEVDKDEVYRVFEKVKNRLLIAGIRKVLRIILRVVDWVIPPDERWIFKIEGIGSTIEVPELDLMFGIVPIEEIYFNNVWFTLKRSKLRQKHRLYLKDVDDYNTVYMREYYISEVVDDIVEPAPFDYFVTWRAEYIDKMEYPKLDLTTWINTLEVFYFNQSWFRVGRDRLNDVYRLYGKKEYNTVMMNELYTYGGILFEPVKDPTYWITRTDQEDLEMPIMNLEYTTHLDEFEIINFNEQWFRLNQHQLDSGYRLFNGVTDVKNVAVMAERYTYGSMIFEPIKDPIYYVDRKDETDIIIDPMEVMLSSSTKDSMTTHIPSEKYHKQERDEDKKINVPGSKMSIWYPDTKQLGVGLFVIGKNRLTREYAEFVVE